MARKMLEKIMAWGTHSKSVTGKWSANTYYVDEATEYTRSDIAQAAYARGIEDAARVAEGQSILDGNYVEWPALGSGNRGVDSGDAVFARQIAKAIRKLAEEKT